MINVSIVIPVYNTSQVLRELIERLESVLNQLNKTYEIILVEDCGQDNSWEVITELVKEGKPIRAFQLMRNHGQHFALKCGLDHSRGNLVITMDDDLQHLPEEIPKLIEAIENDQEIDVVIAKYSSKKHSLFRNMGTSYHKWLRQKMFPGVPKDLSMTSFRIIKKTVVDEIRKGCHAQPRIGLIILTITNRVKNVETKHNVRKMGSSGYSLRKMVTNSIDNVVNYSSLPLRFMSYIGISASIISFMIGLFYFIYWLFGEITVSGFLSTIIIISFSTGLILFSFGIVGEYLTRIVSQQIMSSQYSIREQIGDRVMEGNIK